MIRNTDSSSSSSSSAAKPPWIELPRDVTANILQRLDIVEILLSAQKVCTTWRNVCKDPAMWRVIDMENLGDLYATPYNLDIMCRRAVDRSQGQLIHISIAYFGTNELLRYISERSSQLRRLTLTGCYHISRNVLTEAVAKFPIIEELHLIFMSSILAGDIESISRSCPTLKSFTLTNTWYWHPRIEDNESARAVAENMHGLRHLKLCGNKMTNGGLQAILAGCPYLESLDLRQCFNLVLEGDLGRRCSERINEFLQPFADEDNELDSETYDAEPFHDSQNSDNYSTSNYEDDSHLFGDEDFSADGAIYYVWT